MVRGISKEQAIAEFRSFTAGGQGDYGDSERQVAKRLLEEMAEGNRDPLNKMGKLIGEGIGEGAQTSFAPIVSAFQRVSGATGGPVGGALANVAGGFQSGGVFGGIASAATSAFGSAVGKERSFQDAYLGTPTFLGNDEAHARGVAAQQSSGFSVGREIEAVSSAIGWGSVGKRINQAMGGFGTADERAVDSFEARRAGRVESATERTANYFAERARIGGKFTDEQIQEYVDFQLKQAALEIDARDRVGSIAAHRAKVMEKQLRGLSSDANSVNR